MDLEALFRAPDTGGPRYKVYVLHGDEAREMVTLSAYEEELAVTSAYLLDQLGIYGRTLVRDSATGTIIAVFQSGEPLDPRIIEG